MDISSNVEYEITDNGIRLIEEYNASLARKLLFIVGLAIVLAIMICVACAFGGREVDVASIPGLIWDHINGATYERMSDIWWDDYVVCEVRLPRILVACIAGASLAICGVAVQSLMNNPLASPYTMGISSGAGFGATLAIVMGFSLGSSIGVYGVTFNSFVFGMMPVVVVMMLSRLVEMSPVTLILVGVAISQFFGSLSTLVFLGAEEGSLQAAYLWEIGSLENIKWDAVPLMGSFLIIGSIALYLVSWKFNVLAFGEKTAKTMGVDANKFRIVTLTLLALMTMSVVCYVGIIGFVGLIAPHIVRAVIGSDNRYVMPASLLAGALIVLMADTAARVIATDAVPVGSIMGLFGAPVFLYLIFKRNSQFKGAWRCPSWIRSSVASAAGTEYRPTSATPRSNGGSLSSPPC